MNDTSVKFFKDIDVKSLNINLDEKCIDTENKLMLSNRSTHRSSLYYLTSKDIRKVDNKYLIFKYDFGDVKKIIYSKSLLFIFSYNKLYKYDTLTFVVSDCCYPPQIVFKYNWEVSDVFLEKMFDDNLIIIGGVSEDTKSSKVMIYYVSEDKWITQEPLPNGITCEQLVVCLNTKILQYKMDRGCYFK